MKQFLLYLTAFALAAFTFSCQDEAAISSSEDTQANYSELDAAFTGYEVVELPTADILARSVGREADGFNLDLGLTEHPTWNFLLQHHDFTNGGDYKAYVSGENGDWVEIEREGRQDAYHGQTVDHQSRGMFLMEDNVLRAEIYDADVQYGLDPLSEYVAGASPNQYVLYRLDADIAGNRFECGTEDDVHLDGKQVGGDAFKATCREMSVSYIADYDFYKNKFGRNSTNTRNWMEARLKFGSYRYWGYNDYPLYFWLYRSYVQTNGNNEPSTSSNSSTFLSNYRAWARAGNITRGDANLCYTGTDFGGLFGLAYTSTVCKFTSSGKRRAFGIVTKLSGISSSVYSKVTGHEIGHELGAGHQNSGFMKQGNHSNSSMPTATRNQLNTHINSYNSCMGNKTCVNLRN